MHIYTLTKNIFRLKLACMNQAIPMIIPVLIPGECQLEGLLMLPDGQPKGLALICHPHPLHQGTMHNKVVTTLAKAAALSGYVSLRFNFRGVGKSEGSYGEGHGELIDAQAALAYLQNYFEENYSDQDHASIPRGLPRSDEIQGKTQRKSAVYLGVNEHFEAGFNDEDRASRQPQIVIMGFSFGGYIATQLAATMHPSPKALITIAPALHYEHLQVTQSPDCPWLVVHGEADEVISYEYNQKWLQEKAPKAQWVHFAETGHFFHGKLIALQNVAQDFLKTL